VGRAEFNPSWGPDGALTVATLNLDGGASAVSVGDDGRSIVSTSADSIELPLGWSPDGETLAVRSVEGKTPFESGASHIDLVREGDRERVSDSSDVTIVGWMP
jgi:hypothetical protein